MNKRKTANKYLKRIKGGNVKAFDALFRAFYGYIHDIAYMELDDKSHANDVTEYTFETVYENISEFDESKSGYAWMAEIAKNQARKINRAERKYETVDYDITPNGEYIEDFDGNYNVAQALSMLEPEDREIIKLKVYEDMTYEHIGRVLGMDPHRVYVRYKKILKILKEFYEKP